MATQQPNNAIAVQQTPPSLRAGIFPIEIVRSIIEETHKLGYDVAKWMYVSPAWYKLIMDMSMIWTTIRINISTTREANLALAQISAHSIRSKERMLDIALTVTGHTPRVETKKTSRADQRFVKALERVASALSCECERIQSLSLDLLGGFSCAHTIWTKLFQNLSTTVPNLETLGLYGVYIPYNSPRLDCPSLREIYLQVHVAQSMYNLAMMGLDALSTIDTITLEWDPVTFDDPTQSLFDFGFKIFVENAPNLTKIKIPEWADVACYDNLSDIISLEKTTILFNRSLTLSHGETSQEFKGGMN